MFQQRGFARLSLAAFTHPLFIGLVTYGTLLFELLLFPVLVWVRPLRPWVLRVGVLFHVSISLTMRIFVFGEIMPLFYLSFVNPVPFLAWLGERTRAVLRARAPEVKGTEETVREPAPP